MAPDWKFWISYSLVIVAVIVAVAIGGCAVHHFDAATRLAAVINTR